jgi:hypothetical protein
VNYAYRTFLLVMLLLPVAVATNAQFDVQNIEYANTLCELRIDNRVFVQAPLNTRGELVKEIRKHSDLVIVERPEESDFFLTFTYSVPGADSGNALVDGNAQIALAEMVVFKFVNNKEKGTRPRVLGHWSNQKRVHSVPIPFQPLTEGFQKSRSGRSAAEEIIGRIALWAIGRKWPDHLHFDQLTNQLTINLGGKLERKGAKWFLKELKTVRSDSYAAQCVEALAVAKSNSWRPPSASIRTLPLESSASARSPLPTPAAKSTSAGRRTRVPVSVQTKAVACAKLRTSPLGVRKM